MIDVNTFKNIVQSFNNCIDATKEKISSNEILYYKLLVETVVKPSLITVFRKSCCGVPFDELTYDGKLKFYDALFEEVCLELINTHQSTKNASSEFKNKVMDYMKERRALYKSILQFEETYECEPDTSEYEFDIPRMLADIDRYVDRRLEEFEGPRKK